MDGIFILYVSLCQDSLAIKIQGKASHGSFAERCVLDEKQNLSVVRNKRNYADLLS